MCFGATGIIYGHQALGGRGSIFALFNISSPSSTSESTKILINVPGPWVASLDDQSREKSRHVISDRQMSINHIALVLLQVH